MIYLYYTIFDVERILHTVLINGSPTFYMILNINLFITPKRVVKVTLNENVVGLWISHFVENKL